MQELGIGNLEFGAHLIPNYFLIKMLNLKWIINVTYRFNRRDRQR